MQKKAIKLVVLGLLSTSVLNMPLSVWADELDNKITSQETKINEDFCSPPSPGRLRRVSSARSEVYRDIDASRGTSPHRAGRGQRAKRLLILREE